MQRRNPWNHTWNYCPSLDRWEHQWIGTIVERRQNRCLVWYRRHGYRVGTLADIQTVPLSVQEELVAHIRRRWSRWLMAESLAGAAGGPLGIFLALPVLIAVLTAAGTEIAMAFGVDMNDPAAQTRLQAMLAQELRRSWGTASRRAESSHWLERGRVWVQTLVVLNFGQDLGMAHRILGRMHRTWRRQSPLHPI